MLDIGPILDKLDIRRTNVVFAVADAAVYVSGSINPMATATKVFKDILNVDVEFTDAVYARVAVKRLVVHLIEHGCMVDESEAWKVAETATGYAESFVSDPRNAYLWAQVSEESIQATPVHFVEGIDRKVVVNANGGLKKGGKKVLSFDLYDKHILKSTTPATRKEFITILVEQLGLTLQAASTYHYNLKSGQPGWIPQQ